MEYNDPEIQRVEIDNENKTIKTNLPLGKLIEVVKMVIGEGWEEYQVIMNEGYVVPFNPMQPVQPIIQPYIDDQQSVPPLTPFWYSGTGTGTVPNSEYDNTTHINNDMDSFKYTINPDNIPEAAFNTSFIPGTNNVLVTYNHEAKIGNS